MTAPTPSKSRCRKFAVQGHTGWVLTHGAPSGGVFVGRSDELAELASALDAVRSGHGRAVLVTGDAGVGKTRMVQRAAALAEGFLVLSGACLPLSSLNVPLLPLRSALTGVAANQRPPLDVTAGQVTAEVLDRWLERACEQRPVALVVDDLHWADPATLDVLMWVIAGMSSRHLAVLTTVRRGEAGPGHPLQRWAADVRRLPGFTELSLAPFDLEETREQVAGVLADVPHDSLVHEVFDRTGGNAYLNKLLVTGLPATATSLGDGALPDDLGAAVLRAWHLLSPPARELSRVIAVGGRVARGTALSGASALACVGDPGPLLRECVEAGVFDVHEGDGYWFHHPLQAEALEAGLSAPERHRLHAAFAALLEADIEGTTPDLASAILVADHHHRADDAKAALAWSLRAADIAEADGADAEAVRLLRRAIHVETVLDDHDGSPSRWLTRLREAAERAGDLIEELVAVESLLAGGELDAVDASELIVRRQHLRFTTGAGFLDLAEMNRAVDLSAGTPRSWQHAFALSEAAHAALWADDPAGPGLAVDALARARAGGHPRALAYALAANAMHAVFEERVADARSFATEAVECAARARDGFAFGHATLWEANALGGPANPLWGASVGARRQELIELGLPHPYIAWLTFCEAHSNLLRGDWRGCRTLLRYALGRTPGALVDVGARLVAAQLAALQGRVHEAEGHLARADELFGETSTFLPFQFDAIRAMVRLAAGDPRGCVTAALVGASVPGVPPTMAEWLLPLAARGLADLTQSRRDSREDVRALLEEVDDLQSRFPHAIQDAGGDELYYRQLAGLDGLYAAERARARRSPDRAGEWAQTAELLHDVLPWDECYSLWRLAEALFDADPSQRSDAVDALRRGHRLAQRLAAVPDLEQIRSLARTARIPLTEPEPPASTPVPAGVCSQRARRRCSRTWWQDGPIGRSPAHSW